MLEPQRSSPVAPHTPPWPRLNPTIKSLPASKPLSLIFDYIPPFPLHLAIFPFLRHRTSYLRNDPESPISHPKIQPSAHHFNSTQVGILKMHHAQVTPTCARPISHWP